MGTEIVGTRRVSVVADQSYDTTGCVQGLHIAGLTPPVAHNTKRPGGSAIESLTTRHLGYVVSQRKRKRI